jgi:hypothetical protein
LDHLSRLLGVCVAGVLVGRNCRLWDRLPTRMFGLHNRSSWHLCLWCLESFCFCWGESLSFTGTSRGFVRGVCRRTDPLACGIFLPWEIFPSYRSFSHKGCRLGIFTLRGLLVCQNLSPWRGGGCIRVRERETGEMEESEKGAGKKRGFHDFDDRYIDKHHDNHDNKNIFP